MPRANRTVTPVVGGILVYDGALPPEAAERLALQWNRAIEERKPIVLDGSLEYVAGAFCPHCGGAVPQSTSAIARLEDLAEPAAAAAAD